MTTPMSQEEITERNISAAVDQRWREALCAVDLRIDSVMNRIDNVNERINELVEELKSHQKKIRKESDRAREVIVEVEIATEQLQEIVPLIPFDTMRLFKEISELIEKWRGYDN